MHGPSILLATVLAAQVVTPKPQTSTKPATAQSTAAKPTTAQSTAKPAAARRAPAKPAPHTVTPPPPAPMTDDQKTIYALGLSIFDSLSQFNLSPAELELVKKA